MYSIFATADGAISLRASVSNTSPIAYDSIAEAPGPDAIEELLLKKFGDQVLDDRVKQMIGQMTRQVMEHEGYVIDAKDVKDNGGTVHQGDTL